MKHKPAPALAPDGHGAVLPSAGDRSRGGGGSTAETMKPLKFSLGSGDMILMRGRTQANWLHSIPKRKGGDAMGRGRINITFRRALVPAGTGNYYRYNVGVGEVYRWDERGREMRVWVGGGE